MQHRIFIAINLPEDIKKTLVDYQLKWPELPVRWTKKDNLHITLVFIGYASDEDIGRVCKAAEETVSRHQPFLINLNRICYGPPKKIPYSETKSLTGRRDEIANRPPRMVWVKGETPKELSSLREDLEKSLSDSGIRFESEDRGFTSHITLGRVRTWEWRQIEPEERPEVEEEISLSFPVNSIEVMESQLKRGGAEYTILESIKLEK
ncbi:MAG: hypothetical protein CO031_00210 [Candidatus Nealsonbacteria bacterium CG_4_9_14_0_2_um_filter_37_38]|uniref:RNA 2',3'-cyclic phosphodiesterase n=1 Tax=Candidatus Nealsonbacteria bacterium CG_4_10_14_0_8_um_filter_37_14 TaxID=1974684 RepID=A0A2M7R6B6_9BACT|nr:MAG: hypothetical protein COV63_00455 [Candidatus Nealsonbacteria bacterium CG11_big_fil_rev_8_21_14_0_20_37_68]PIW91795.1 MAG: hypothetical protein COZ89_03305 [Candidatus Nealsonbacteria bacterium CG_4_8_14_3_um_filter_37_23]PIY89103.1 MAG: hypothetical protein COY73_01945 [Candidatus Nealsonbacteria bacterium CG_4_10_14_0_8_um_filter_37_14]PJC51910.1 MAG: hypothetical protein CO031_00210 [Candidatus Nealsonbacteria bacterium CG_4_9_14_0_2_um_filter_37_38]